MQDLFVLIKFCYIDKSVLAPSFHPTKEYNAEAVASGKISVQLEDVSSLSLPAKTYDLATAFETIYFWPDLEKCFSNVASVLKSEALFLIVNEIDGIEKFGKQFEKIIDGMTVYTSEEIESVLKKAGFSIVKAEHHPAKPWIMILAKK